MSPTLLNILLQHDYWRKAWGYDRTHPRFRAINMIHQSSPHVPDKRKWVKRPRSRPITYDTMRILKTGGVC